MKIPNATNNRILINVLLDMSGSMLASADETISGYNEYIDTLKHKTPNAIISVYTFQAGTTHGCCEGSWITKLCVGVPIADAPKLNRCNYRPEGGTPLYDAIGKAIAYGDETIHTKDLQKSLMVVMTDGYENMSREYSRSRVKELMSHYENTHGWTFVFLGADLDAFDAVTSMGLPAHHGNTLSYGRCHTEHVFRSILSSATVAYAADERYGSRNDTITCCTSQTERDALR